MTARDAAHAASRFGLGPRPGELARIGSDPRGWLSAQLDGTPPLPADLSGRPGGAERIAALMTARDSRDEGLRETLRREAREAYRADAAARTRAAARSDRPFRERLVQFWSNHFTVSAARPEVINAAGPFEIEAIRPHVTGHFAELLKAVVGHPAMLLYLDNAVSIGPNSIAGRRRNRGLNENLARELLELHTLGVDGGYGQDDVRALAAILTGWTVGRPRDPQPGTARFEPLMHEPGDKTLLGRRYPEAGQAEGTAALEALAGHPATARHVATKLARHFIADAPPAAAVARLDRVFRETGGDLRAVSAALVELPEAWAEPLAKVRTPNDLVTAALRALDPHGPDRRDDGPGAERGDGSLAVAALHLLGQQPFMAPSPAGWPDTAEAWMSPEALTRRIEWALAVGRRLERVADPRRLAEQSLGPLASPATQFLVNGAPSAAEGIALVLASPEFQRR